MSEVSLTTRVKRMLNKCLPAAWAAKLGDRLYEMESYGVLAHSYANDHAAKTYAFADLPIAPIVRITLTLANAPADLVLPAATNKVYIINNTSGQTITVKCADQTGTALANNGRYVCWSNGTDIITSVPEVTLAGAQTLVNKTMTSPILTTPKIADGDAGLTVTSANQTNAAAIATVPDIGGCCGRVCHEGHGTDTDKQNFDFACTQCSHCGKPGHYVPFRSARLRRSSGGLDAEHNRTEGFHLETDQCQRCRQRDCS